MSERTTEEIKAQLAAIKRAIGSGVTSVSYDGRTVTYKTHDDMVRAQRSLQAELAAAGESLETNRRKYALVAKGY